MNNENQGKRPDQIEGSMMVIVYCGIAAMGFGMGSLAVIIICGWINN